MTTAISRGGLNKLTLLGAVSFTFGYFILFLTSLSSQIKGDEVTDNDKLLRDLTDEQVASLWRVSDVFSVR